MNIDEVTGRLEVTGLGSRGDGLSGDLGVAYTLPGDVIEGGQLVERSPHRVDPGCPHFGRCGGCQLQHASDTFLADWKAGLVRQALRAQELPEDIRAVHVSPPRSRRRVTFSGRRTKKTVQLGFFARRSDQLVPITQCDLLEPQIMERFEALKAVVRLAATRTSVVKLMVTCSDAGLDLAVSDARDLEPEGLGQLAKLAEGFARIAWNGEVVLLAKLPAQQFGPALVVPPPGAFLQATAHGEEALLRAVQDGVGTGAKAVDLFAGCGTFALPLAAAFDVHAVEFDGSMLKALDQGWRKTTGLKHLSTEARDLFRRPLLFSEFKGVDAVVIDPPRAGAQAQIAELAQADLGRIVHVSCNPVTFARDARVLVDVGFELAWVEVVDQFRWSTHVELVGCFRRGTL